MTSQKPQYITFDEVWGVGVTDDVNVADEWLAADPPWAEGPECDPLDMNSWALYHVFMKVKGWVWDPELRKALQAIWTEAMYVRAPNPDAVMDAPRRFAALEGNEILTWDAAWIKGE